MKVPTSLMIVTIFQLFKCATANWDPNDPLILVQRGESMKVFPKVVRLVNQRKVYINAGEENSVTTYAYCPNRNYGYPYCNYYGTLRNGQMVRNRPTQRCEFPVDFVMMKQMNTHNLNLHQPCSHNDRNGHKYDFIYWLCRYDTVERTPIITYEMCYDDNEMQMILGRFIIYTPHLLTNLSLSTEHSFQFELDTSHYHDDNTQNISGISRQLYDRALNVPLGRTYYVPRPVLPPEWIPFAHRRKALFSHMNCAPMDVRLIRAWETLMENLRSKISDLPGIHHVKAGLLGVIRDNQNEKLYLGNEKIPVPKQFWVMIHDHHFTEGIVIAMDNELLHPVDQEYFDTACSLHVCNVANLFGTLPPQVENSYNPFIYCCPPHTITGRFNLRETNAELLEFP